jgi:DNA replication and repair protein RecF
MPITHLKVRNFRNLASLDLDLAEGVNLFYGENAQGKTAVLESVCYLATSTSHRTRKDEELIQWGQPAAYTQAELTDGEVEKLEFGLSREGKQVKVDGEMLKKIGDLYGLLRVVLFVPEDLEIVNGGPAARRRFLDQTLAQVDKQHIPHLQKYQHVLRSRNQLLKRAEGKKLDPVEMDIWDGQLVEAAIPIEQARQQAVRELAGDLSEFYGRMTGGREDLHMRYIASVTPEEGQSLEQAYSERLAATRHRDLQQGSTSAGPHRDDLLFLLEGKDLRAYGSQGQRRTSVLALRLAELEWLRRKTGQHPLMLLDDVIYEMDEGRREHFFEEISRGGQVLITATEVEHLAPLVTKAKIFEVQNGVVKQAQEQKEGPAAESENQPL